VHKLIRTAGGEKKLRKNLHKKWTTEKGTLEISILFTGRDFMKKLKYEFLSQEEQKIIKFYIIKLQSSQ
jgi:hypothetical protein